MKRQYVKIGHYWNSKNVFIVSLLVFIFFSFVSFYLGDKPFLKHVLEIGVSLTLFLFFFLFYGLYKGYRWLEDSIDLKYKILDLKIVKEFEFLNPEIPDFDGDTGIIGILAALFLWAIFGVFLLLFCLFFLSVAWAGLVLLITILHWIFYRGLRIVFIRSKQCRGNIVSSFQVSFRFTAAYIGWVLCLLYIYDYLRTSGS